jgi:hypothetical protein
MRLLDAHTILGQPESEPPSGVEHGCTRTLIFINASERIPIPVTPPTLDEYEPG